MAKQLVTLNLNYSIRNCLKKTLLVVSVFLLLSSISTHSWAGKIVYPWRSTTAIVKAGETFEIWFSADAGQIVNSIELQSPYIKVNGTITNSLTQTWAYDQWSGNTVCRYGSETLFYYLILTDEAGKMLSKEKSLPFAIPILQ